VKIVSSAGHPRFVKKSRFCTSDPDMIRLFCRWLKLLGVTQDQMRVSVQIHESADVTHAERS